MTREEKEQTGKYVLQMARLLEDGCYQQEMLLKAVHIINEALEQESNTWSLDDAREDFMHDVYSTLAFLPTNEEANRIIDSFDRVTSSIKQEPILDKVRAEIITCLKALDEIEKSGFNIYLPNEISGRRLTYQQCLGFIDKYKEPKTGYWYIDERPESNREVICSNCEQPIFKYHKLDFDYRPKYCPNCGIKMVESQESEDKEW